jgi:hypothetical protein
VTAAVSAEEALSVVSAIDLSGIMAKLRDPVAGKGWDAEQAALAEREYRRFLALHLMHPGVPLTPSKLVDEVWHAHILDTRNYERDTKAVLGRFLHHDAEGPASGPATSDEGAVWESTRELYRAAFEA